MLLRLKDQDFPDTRQIEDWLTWDLPILQWAKSPGAVTGFAHSGLGLYPHAVAGFMWTMCRER